MDAQLYGEMWATEQSHWWFVGRRRIVRSLVKRHRPIESGDRLRICELGCGTAGNIAAWADQHDVVGVDASPQALEFARQRLGDRALYGRLPAEIPLPAESFDVVLATDVFEHIADDAGSVRTAVGLLRPGGILVATVPAYQWLYSPRDAHHHHFRRYDRNHYRRLFQLPDVKIELLSFYNTLLFPPALVVRLANKWLRRRPDFGDLRIPPQPLNALLATLFGLEDWLLRLMSLPFGLSLIVVARKLPGPLP